MVSTNTQSSGEYLLEMSGINKSFPGVKALDNVNLKVRPHSIHALMGENGAGKSTLLKCLFGIYQKDSGSILFQGIGREPSGKPGSWSTSSRGARGRRG